MKTTNSKANETQDISAIVAAELAEARTISLAHETGSTQHMSPQHVRRMLRPSAHFDSAEWYADHLKACGYLTINGRPIDAAAVRAVAA